MKLEQHELEAIQQMNNEFSKAKMSLGELELNKHQILKGIEQLKAQFEVHEKKLVEKYGANAVINIQTGEVTEKTENK
jgi:hypothetical protein